MPKRTRDLTIEQQLARGPMDLPFLMLVAMLTGIGVIMVFSASYPTAVNEGKAATHYFTRQVIFAALGMAAMYLTSRWNYQRLRWMSVFILAAAFVLLVTVLTPLGYGRATVGAQRWIRVPFVGSFQPSEAAKLGVILYFSARMSKRRSEKKKHFSKRMMFSGILNKLDDWGFFELVPYAAILLGIALLMYLEPHLSGTILILVPAAAILFAGGVGLGWFALGGAGVAALMLVFMQGYQSQRILTWRDPWAYPKDGGYQIIQSLYAVGSGGLFGVGFGQGRQKQLFLPEAENDFIFSVACEELGLIGAGLILLLFVLLIVRGYWIALHARDRFGSLLVVGIITLMAVQVFLNVSVVTNLLPTTGISLPFFSYGGTALVLQLVEMGIVLSVSRQVPAPRQG